MTAVERKRLVNKLELVPGQDTTPMTALTLRPRNGLRMGLSVR